MAGTRIRDIEEQEEQEAGRGMLVSMRVKLACITLAYIAIAGLTTMLSYGIIARAINPLPEAPDQGLDDVGVIGMGKMVHVEPSPEGKLFAVTTPLFVHLFDPECGLTRSIGPINDSAWRARFSPSGRELAILTNTALEVWSIDGEKLSERALNWPTPSGLAVFWTLLRGSFGWSPGGDLIAMPINVQNTFAAGPTNMNCTLLLWSWRDRQDMAMVDLTGLAQCLEWPGDNEILIGEAFWRDGEPSGRASSRDAVSLQFKEGIELGEWNIPVAIETVVNGETVSSVSLTLSTDREATLLLYQVPGWRLEANLTTGHGQAACSAWSPDQAMVAIGHGDGYLGVWDTSGGMIAEFTEPMGITSLGWLTPNRLVAENCMGRVITYQLAPPGALCSLGPFGGDPLAISWKNQTQLYALWSDINYTSPDWLEYLPVINTVTGYNPETSEWLDLDLGPRTGKIICLDGPPRGDVLALGTETGLEIVRASTWESIATIETERPIRLVDYSLDGTLLAYATQGIAVRDAWNMDEILDLPQAQVPVALAFSNTDRRLAFTTGQGCSIVDLSTISIADLAEEEVEALAWSPDGSTIALASTGPGRYDDPEYWHESLEISLWDTDTLRKKAEISWTGRQHQYSSGWVCGPDISMAWSKDSQHLVVGTHLGDLLILDESLEVVGDVRTFPCPIHAVTPSPTSSKLALGLGDGTIRLMDPGQALSTQQKG